MAQASLLLYPADITEFDLDGPRYAEVTSRRGGSTHVKILPGQGGGRARLTTIASDTVTLRQVPRAELRSGQPGLLLFRPVYGMANGVFHHGQVISYNGRAYAVRTASGTHEVPYQSTVEVAPVLAMLLWEAVFQPTITTTEALETSHSLIPDRLLGQNGQRATKATSRLLAGIVSRQSCPRPSDTIPWMSPRTGEDRVLRLGDVVNFAFYKDGNRTMPSNVRLGATFSDPPQRDASQGAYRTRSRGGLRISRQGASAHEEDVDVAPPARSSGGRQSHQPTDQAQNYEPAALDESDTEAETARFTDLLNSLATDGPAPKRRRTEPPSVPQPTSARVVQSIPVATATPDTPLPSGQIQAILQLLAPHPQLAATYAQQILHLSPAASAGTSWAGGLSTPMPAPYVGQVPSVSDLIPIPSQSGTSKQQFRPSRAQQEVHNAISAPAYIGKDDDIYMDHVRTSASTHFLAHPAVTSRLHDFQFGVCDLSVLHFPRFDLNDKLDRKKAHAVNMRNFSTKVVCLTFLRTLSTATSLSP
ncbi:hypothetical protein PR003_g22507 [Phytophthora rubi]|uniref:Uncharacterized protein n=1 Tax=Phytophthora rubi TaxID=129364 RepID=A0A6A4D9D6_9STRA|nr:hypothetical protein PR001_g21488 [Phytophthora rubi]KAE9016493.1 hypothetical protein PR002_g13639 [Phytophthora rubi]KAE9301473.1 hypothetical protein PR003_g22507 [Phytophthora rubi]